MKVLQINTVISYGSTGRLCRDIADTLELYGHECTIVYGRGADVPGYNTMKVGSKVDNFKHYTKSYLFNRHGFGSLGETKKLIKKIDEYNPDIIQIHNIHGYYLHIGALFEYLKKANKPVVWLLHDQWAFSGGSAYFNVVEDGKTSKRIGISKTKKEYPKALTRLNEQKNYKEKEAIFSNLAKGVIITPSKWLENSASHFFLKKYPIKTIYNGVDQNKFKPLSSNLRLKYNIQNKKIVLAVASVWDARKGTEFIKKLPNSLNEDIQIVMIGVDDKLKIRLPKSVIAISQTRSIKELAEWYSVADVLINPTLFDNFPTVNIEALACGTPVITYNTGGSGEAVDSRTGKVIAQNNQQDFIEAINTFPRKTLEISEACVNRSKLFIKENQYKKYIELYESLL